jgi:hypothetical protein
MKRLHVELLLGEEALPVDIAFVPDDPKDQIPYDEAVEQGRRLVLVMKDSQFELGKIADRLEPKYGDSTLQRFAEDIGIDYGTLKSYRTTQKAWKDQPARPKGFSVAKALNPHPRKAEVIQEKPDISVKEAEKEVQTWKEERRTEKKNGATEAPRSDHAIHMTTGKIVTEIDNFLAEGSKLTAMILELIDDLEPRSSHGANVIKALENASERIQTLSEIISDAIKPDTVMDQAEADLDEAEFNARHSGENRPSMTI